VVSAESFREHLVELTASLPEEAVVLMLEQAQQGKLEGWDKFTDEEKGIVLTVLGAAVLAAAGSVSSPTAGGKEEAKVESKAAEEVSPEVKVPDLAPPQVVAPPQVANGKV